MKLLLFSIVVITVLVICLYFLKKEWVKRVHGKDYKLKFPEIFHIEGGWFLG